MYWKIYFIYLYISEKYIYIGNIIFFSAWLLVSAATHRRQLHRFTSKIKIDKLPVAICDCVDKSLHCVVLALSQVRICRPPSPPHHEKWQFSQKKMCNVLKQWKFISQIFSFWVIGVQKVTKDVQKTKFYSKVAKFTGKIWQRFFTSIAFFLATLSFWDMVNFINDCVHTFQVFLPTRYSQ